MAQPKIKPSIKTKPSLATLQALIQTVHRLRAPNGCPWDRAQTHQTLRQYLIEESYEVIDTLDQIESGSDLQRNPDLQKAFREELGDLLMQILLHSEIASEEGAFTVFDVAQTLNEKLIRRHPHVFGDSKADSAASALKNWEREKAKEKDGTASASVLDGVPKGLPTLQRASRVLEKVSRVGFQWDELQSPLAKIDEELGELKEVIAAYEEALKKKAEKTEREKLRVHLEAELGDVLFSLCNIAYLLKISPEDALRTTLQRFERRFRHVEQKIKGQGKKLEESTLDEMDVFWNEAKTMEKTGILSTNSRKQKNPFRVWGLTGGIASGKTLAARFFREEGIPVIDADHIATELTQKGGSATGPILKRFGTVDRAKLREIIFEDPSARKDLEAILHPLIEAESIKQMHALPPDTPIVYEAALLVETGRHQHLEGLLVVDAPQNIRVERLMKRDQISKSLAQKILAAQASDDDRRKVATVLLDNSGSPEKLKKQVQKIAKQLLNKGA